MSTTHSHTDSHLAHQFSDIEQQNESYIVGMWTFLVTEILFFGALFTAYIVYRTWYPEVFAQASRQLDVNMGALNTFILLTSSWTMALGVRAATMQQRKKLIIFLLLTILFAFGFLVVKYFEYSAKFEHHLVPGDNFHFDSPVPQNQAQLFFSLYFAMTGLHGLHVLVGIILISALVYRARKMDIGRSHDPIPVEMVGLYWHFVDIVWIFLYPLLYLINVSGG